MFARAPLGAWSGAAVCGKFKLGPESSLVFCAGA